MNLTQITDLSLFDREAVPAIETWLDDPRILVLVGARQVGKTSLLYLLIQRLLKDGIRPAAILYLDLEDFEILEILNRGVRDFLRYLKAEGMSDNERCYVFVDEIQYMEDPSRFLKLIADHHKNLKLICSGSSTLEIRRKFTDPLAGRKVVFEIPTLTFWEYLQFKEEKQLADLLRDFPIESNFGEPPLGIHLQQLQAHYEQYLVYGGYPAITLEGERERKLVLLRDIYESYVRKDINQLFSVENLMAFNDLVRLLALQIGNLVNMQELTASLAISRPTLEKYVSVWWCSSLRACCIERWSEHPKLVLGNTLPKAV